MKTLEITRHDMPASFKGVISAALATDTIDLLDFYCMAANHGNNWSAFVDDLIETAYCWIHSDSSKHSIVVEAAEKFWQETL